jgi:hypothetical protein
MTAFVLGACGSSSGVSGAQADLIKKADSICANAQDAIGRTLGDDAAKDRDAVHAASDKLMALKAPSEDQTTWMLFVQNVNNLWISLDDVAQAQDPTVNETSRIAPARARIRDLNKSIIKYATDYHMNDCARGFGNPL